MRDLPPEVPVHRISAEGEATRIGNLITVWPGQFWYEDLESPRHSAEFASLPWFLTDMRPQGYLGRLFPVTYPGLGLPERPAQWNEEQALYALARRGEDAVGNLILGEESLARWLASSGNVALVTEDSRLVQYAELADAAVSGRVAGSSAAGEQPKFTAVIGTHPTDTRHVIVKFSGVLDTAAARRWADLLLAEHLVSVVLVQHGHAASRTQYFEDGRRAYLEVERFDRIGGRGRRGLVSLGALDDEFVGKRMGWPEAASGLRRALLIGEEDERELRWLSAFGALIGNTDMHLGNASFLVDGRRKFQLAPAYDMLPMLFAPVRDEVPVREFRVSGPRPGNADQWLSALPVAVEFWERVVADGRVSEEFRSIARDVVETL